MNFDLTEVNLPPKNRFNIGFNFSRDRYFGDLDVTYTDSAFWQDVLDDRYHGTTDAVHAGQRRRRACKWANNTLTTSVKVINLFNQRFSSTSSATSSSVRSSANCKVQF